MLFEFHQKFFAGLQKSAKTAKVFYLEIS